MIVWRGVWIVGIAVIALSGGGCGLDLSGSSIYPARPAGSPMAANPAAAPAAPGQFTPTVTPVLIPPDPEDPYFLPGVGLVPGG